MKQNGCLAKDYAKRDSVTDHSTGVESPAAKRTKSLTGVQRGRFRLWSVMVGLLGCILLSIAEVIPDRMRQLGPQVHQLTFAPAQDAVTLIEQHAVAPALGHVIAVPRSHCL